MAELQAEGGRPVLELLLVGHVPADGDPSVGL